MQPGLTRIMICVKHLAGIEQTMSPSQIDFNIKLHLVFLSPSYPFMYNRLLHVLFCVLEQRLPVCCVVVYLESLSPLPGTMGCNEISSVLSLLRSDPLIRQRTASPVLLLIWFDGKPSNV